MDIQGGGTTVFKKSILYFDNSDKFDNSPHNEEDAAADDNKRNTFHFLLVAGCACDQNSRSSGAGLKVATAIFSFFNSCSCFLWIIWIWKQISHLIYCPKGRFPILTLALEEDFSVTAL